VTATEAEAAVGESVVEDVVGSLDCCMIAVVGPLVSKPIAFNRYRRYQCSGTNSE